MNIVMVSESFFPEGSGGELATYLLATLLKDIGMNVKVITSSSRIPKSVVDGSTVYTIPTGKHTKYSVVSKAPILLREPLKRIFEWSDIVYMTSWLPAIPLIRRKFKRPVVVHLHSSFPACPIGTSYCLTEKSLCTLNSASIRCARCITSYEISNSRDALEIAISSLLNSTIGSVYVNFLKSADAVVFVSESQKEFVLKRLPIINDKSFKVYNPLPRLPYIPVGGNDLGYFGGTSPLKGFYALTRAWSKICNKHDARLHVSLAEKILEYQDSFKKAKIVLHGRLSGHTCEEVYKSIRAVLVPSIIHEALPYVVSEACLRGRAVIASRIGGIPEQVNGLDGVRLVKPGDVDELADAIDEVLSMDKEVVEVGINNREGILRKFDNSRTVSELTRVFEKVSN